MANYYAVFRSNYFGVKDPEAFKAWCAAWNLEFIEMTKNGKQLVGFLNVRATNENGIQETRYDPETGAYDEESDFFTEIADHLAPGQVAVVQEVGNEKLRYLRGISIAIDSTGETLTVDTNDIYHLVEREWGKSPTRAEY